MAFSAGCDSFCYTCDACDNMQDVWIDDIHNEHDDSALEEIAIEDIGNLEAFRSSRVCQIQFNVNIPCKVCKEDIKVGVWAKAYRDWGPPSYEEVKWGETPTIEEFKNIHDLEVLPMSTYPEIIDNDSDDDFDDDDVYDDSETFSLWSEIDEELSSQESLEKKPIPLKIIVKSAMKGGYCHLGFDAERQKIFRPIYRQEDGRCCWDRPLEVGKTYSFSVLRSPDDNSTQGTPLPHRNEDLYIDHKLTSELRDHTPPNDLFNELRGIAKKSVEDIFEAHLVHDHKYVDEETNCPSVGVLECKGNSLKLFRDNFDKRRIICGQYNFRITVGYTDTYIKSILTKPTLLILGLGRPFDGGLNQRTLAPCFSPRRCYIIVVGIVEKQ